jgi:hypothetical protein
MLTGVRMPLASGTFNEAQRVKEERQQLELGM